MPAIRALSPVNTEILSAFCANPARILPAHEFPNSNVQNVVEIFNHAHAVLLSVPGIEQLQPRTGENIAGEAIFGIFFPTVAIQNPARNARLGFILFPTKTTRTLNTIFPHGSITDTAVHTARSDVFDCRLALIGFYAQWHTCSIAVCYCSELS